MDNTNENNTTAPSKEPELTDAEMLLIKQSFGWYNDDKYPDWK